MGAIPLYLYQNCWHIFYYYELQNSDEGTILKAKLNPDMAIMSIDDNSPTINDFMSVFNLTDILEILLPLPEASITSVQHSATFFFFFLCGYFIFHICANSFLWCIYIK